MIIPEQYKEQEVKVGQAVFVGPGIHEHGHLVPMQVHVGSKFVYHPLSVEAVVKYDGEDYEVIAENNVIAVFADKKMNSSKEGN